MGEKYELSTLRNRTKQEHDDELHLQQNFGS